MPLDVRPQVKTAQFEYDSVGHTAPSLPLVKKSNGSAGGITLGVTTMAYGFREIYKGAQGHRHEMVGRQRVAAERRIVVLHAVFPGPVVNDCPRDRGCGDCGG